MEDFSVEGKNVVQLCSSNGNLISRDLLKQLEEMGFFHENYFGEIVEMTYNGAPKGK